MLYIKIKTKLCFVIMFLLLINFNNNYIGLDVTSPYSLTFNTHNTFNGWHNIQIIVSDLFGNVGQSQISVNIYNLCPGKPCIM